MLLFLFTWLSCSFPDSTERQEMVVAVVLQCGAKRVQVWSSWCSCWGHTSAPPCGILLVHPYRDLHNLLWICTWHELLEKGGRAWDGGWEDWCDFTVWFLAVEYKMGLLTSSVPRMGTAWESRPAAAPKAGKAQPQRLETQPSAVLLRNSFSTMWK